MSASAEPPSFRDLIDRLGHPDRLERVHAAADLVKLGRQGKRPVPALVQALREERRVAVRKMAALVLGDLAPHAQEALPALIDALRDSDEGLRRRAAVALGRFGGAAVSALPALRLSLSDPDEGVRSFAASALALIDPDDGGRSRPAA
jgi:HEAT repeat protein